MEFDSRKCLLDLRLGKSVMPKLIADHLERNHGNNDELREAATEAINRGISMVVIDEWGSVTHKEI